MKTLEYNIRFITPAFLGNAEQNGQWRTPPFKALLRQWWRVVYAANKNFQIDLKTMLHEEGLLFGHAGQADNMPVNQAVIASKSKLRLRLENSNEIAAWSTGSQRGVEPLSQGLDTSYAWFGLIKRGNNLPERSAIKPGVSESVRLIKIAMPDGALTDIKKSTKLIHAFGLLGSRSRGGWGAFQVEGMDALNYEELLNYAQEISACLKNDWAMSLAKDENGLCIWESKNTFDSWDKAMRFIALQRKQVRSNLKSEKDDLRAALGFASPGRMPSPLRWKVLANEPNKLFVRVFALPHHLPQESGKSMSLSKLLEAWNRVFQTLDGQFDLQRVK